MKENEPYQSDIAWLTHGFNFKYGVNPVESKIDAFVEKVSIICAEGHDEMTARRMAFDVLEF